MVTNMYINGILCDKVKLKTINNSYEIKVRISNTGEWIELFNGNPKVDGIKITLQLMTLLNQDELLIEEK